MRLSLNYAYTDRQVEDWIMERIRVLFQVNAMYYWIDNPNAILQNPDVSQVLGFLIGDTNHQRIIIWKQLSTANKVALMNMRRRDINMMGDKMRAALILLKLYNKRKLRMVQLHLMNYMTRDVVQLIVQFL